MDQLQTDKHLSLLRSVLLAIVIVTITCLAVGQEHVQGPLRDITVSDIIGMASVSMPEPGTDHPATDGPAYFSPNGEKFVVVLEKPKLDSNLNEFSLLLFRTSSLFSGATPETLITMSSSSNRAAIREIMWLSDNETVAFLGESPGESSQVYTVSVVTRKTERRTNYPRSVDRYDMTGDGRELVFLAEAKKTRNAELESRVGIPIVSQYLVDLVAGDCAQSLEDDLLIQTGSEPPVQVHAEDAFHYWSLLSISRDGDYAVVQGFVHEPPKLWLQYADQELHERLTVTGQKGQAFLFTRYLLIDRKHLSAVPLLNTPVLTRKFTWAPDSREVLIKDSYLPLDVSDASEREQRSKTHYNVAINVETGQYRKLNKGMWNEPEHRRPAKTVFVRQELTSAPALYALEVATGRTVQLLDLNPQFKELRFGSVKTIEADVAGARIQYGVYLPPNFKEGQKYPLVVQTHGFEPEEFSMDGRSEWSSAYAARALAASGIMVLQAFNYKDKTAGQGVSEDRTLGSTPQQSHKKFDSLVYLAGIDSLDKLGYIDRERVGIIGFSRTVCYVGYTLTHSGFRFAAATLVDGITCGYFPYIAVPTQPSDANDSNGGVAPFGDGMAGWLKESPGFRLNDVHAPVQLIALGPYSVLGLWEWFAGLTLQQKPVDFIEIPDAEHQIVKPWERRIAQQGIVDWFRFWLQGEEDPIPEKSEQYSRWRQLKNSQIGTQPH